MHRVGKMIELKMFCGRVTVLFGKYIVGGSVNSILTWSGGRFVRWINIPGGSGGSGEGCQVAMTTRLRSGCVLKRPIYPASVGD